MGHPHEETVSSRGFSLIELLVACALLVVVGGAVAAMATPVRDALDRATLASDLDIGRRLAVEMLAADLRGAGSDPAVAGGALLLARVLPRVVPLPDLASSTFGLPATAVRVNRAPPFGAQGVLAMPAAAGAVALQLETTTRCAGGPPACSFTPGMTVVVYDGAASHVASVGTVGTALVVLDTPLTTAFAAGAVVTELERVTYGLRVDPDGSARLVRLTGGGAEQPLLDHVVEFRVEPDTADLWHLRRVDLRVRLEAGPAAFRGPAGYLFRRGGTAVSARRWVPDVEIRFGVALRNPPGAI